MHFPCFWPLSFSFFPWLSFHCARLASRCNIRAKSILCANDGDIWINLSMVMYEDSLHCYLGTFTRDQTWDQGHLRQEMVFVLSVTNGCCGWWNNIFLILTAIKIKWTQSNHNKIINDIIKSWRFEYSLQQILFFQLHYIAHTQYPSNIEVKVSMDPPG